MRANCLVGILSAIFALCVGAPAWAAECGGAVPSTGALVKGPVLHVIDGETLCVAQGFTPDKWVTLRLAPEGADRVSARTPPRGALMAAAFGKNAVCRVLAVAGGQALAHCTVEGRSVFAEARQPRAVRASAAWR